MAILSSVYTSADDLAPFRMGFRCESRHNIKAVPFGSALWLTQGEGTVHGLQVGGSEAALFDYARGGPQWGADSLIIGPPQVRLSLHDLQLT